MTARSDWQRVIASVWRMPRATLAALIAAWTAVVVALWAAVLGAAIAVVVLIVQPAGSTTSTVVFNLHTGGVVTALSLVAAAATGAVVGFTATYGALFVGHIAEVASSLLSGCILAAVISWVALKIEPRLLFLRGYRLPSRRELDQTITPAVAEIAVAMELDTKRLPLILVADTPMPQAWSHANTIIVTKGLMEGLDPPEFRAILAHEFSHWRMGDSVALRLVWALSWPLAISYNLASFLSGSRFAAGAINSAGVGAGDTTSDTGIGTTHAAYGVVQVRPSALSALTWFVFWPVGFLIRFVIVPIASYEGRRIEYQADEGVAAIGMGDGLIRALERFPPFEAGRTAWEAALARTHPPIEHRIDRLEYLGDLGVELPPLPASPTRRHIRAVLAGAAVLLFVALTPLVTGGGGNKVKVAQATAAAPPTPPTPAQVQAASHPLTSATTTTAEPAQTTPTPTQTSTEESPTTVHGTDTPSGAVSAAASFAADFYDHIYDQAQYASIIESDAAPGDAEGLISSANAHFAADAKAVSGQSATMTATVLADQVTGTTGTPPTHVSVELWIESAATINGARHQGWAVVPYTFQWWYGSWRVSSISTPSNGPDPGELHGAAVPPGFTAYSH